MNRFTEKLPDFLIIGAMKAGTTGLCDDLSRHPAVFIPSVKEPHFLVDDAVLSTAGRRRYAKLFADATMSQRRGEGSTGYTKLPDIHGVPERAKRLFGPELKLVYLVRNPIERAISHHFHLYRGGDIACDMDAAVRECRALIEYGKYAAQLQPWLDAFDLRQVHVLRFEDYIANRRESVAGVCRFLDLETTTVDLVARQDIANSGTTAPRPNPALKKLLRGVTRSQWYKIHVHPRLPASFKDALKPAFFRKPLPRPPRPSKDTMKWIAEQFREDGQRLQKLLQYEHPLWDLDGVDEAPTLDATTVELATGGLS